MSTCRGKPRQRLGSVGSPACLASESIRPQPPLPQRERLEYPDAGDRTGLSVLVAGHHGAHERCTGHASQGQDHRLGPGVPRPGLFAQDCLCRKRLHVVSRRGHHWVECKPRADRHVPPPQASPQGDQQQWCAQEPRPCTDRMSVPPEHASVEAVLGSHESSLAPRSPERLLNHDSPPDGRRRDHAHRWVSSPGRRVARRGADDRDRVDAPDG